MMSEPDLPFTYENCTEAPPIAEVRSLLDLFNSTNGNKWQHKWPVEDDDNPCSPWYGVYCSYVNDMCHVVALDLIANDLSGSIPSTISNLSDAIIFRLSANYLTGTIPTVFTEMPSLMVLSLSGSQLYGTLPPFGQYAANLRVLELGSNSFEGRIPASFANLTELRGFYISENQLTGPIPDFVWKSWTKMTTLDMSYNAFTGTIPTGISTMQYLSSLNVGVNNFHASPFPAWLSRMTNLTYLYLYTTHLTGTIPRQIANLTRLSQLSVSDNLLTGTLPEELGRLEFLSGFDVNTNLLTGTFPDSILSMSALQSFLAYNNQFTGTLTTAIGNASSLSYVEIHDNLLSGTLPSTLADLHLLNSFIAGTNSLGGFVSTELCSLTNLVNIDLENNVFSGSIPSCVGNITALTQFKVNNNFLTGTLPQEMGYLNAILFIDVANNFIQGIIPTTYGHWSNPAALLFFSNFISGTIPSAFGTFPSLLYLIVEDNQMSISMSDLFSPGAYQSMVAFGASENVVSGNFSISLPSRLSYLDLASATMNGTLPVDWLRSPILRYLDLSDNRFSGTLPPEVFSSTIQRLLLNDNLLTGTLPPTLDPSETCGSQYLSISNNKLSGSLPSFLHDCSQLVSFVASNMALTGSIEGLFNNMTALQELVLANNEFTGPIDDVFARSNATQIVLNAAYNQFTGTLPVDSLATGRWQAVILTENCLSGTLPGDALCANEGMTEIVLSGLHTASTCRRSVLPSMQSLHFYTSYSESTSVGGSLPGCLLSLPELTYLTLSGNNLQGTLPYNVNLSQSMEGIDLSHNNLVGTIPLPLLQTTELTLVDLSFNRLSGSIPLSVTAFYEENSAAQLSLQVNMLSGKLPAQWVDATFINVLNGNMFSCAPGNLTSTWNVPVNDPLASSYACGSMTTNMSLLVTFLLGVVVSIVLGGIYLFADGERRMLRWVEKEWNALQTLAIRYKRETIRIGLVMGLLVVAMALYSLLAVYTSVYAELYIWVISVALQQGPVASGLLFVWFAVCIVAIQYAAGHHQRYSPREEDIETTATTTATRDWKPTTNRTEDGGEVAPSTSCMAWWALPWSTLALISWILTLHAVPVFVINMLYVYSTTLNYSMQRLTGIALAMACFKLVWNGGFNFLLFKNAHVILPALPVRQLSSFLANVGVFNLIVSPILTESLASPNCFQYAFRAIPTNTYAVAGGTCYWIYYSYAQSIFYGSQGKVAFPCMSYDELQATYNSGSPTEGGNFDMIVISTFSNGEASTVDFEAGFSYNFQCSFSLLEAFVHVFIYRYALGIFVVPLVWLLLKRGQLWAYRVHGRSSRWFQQCQQLLPPLYRLVDVTLPMASEMNTDAVHEETREVMAANAAVLQRFNDKSSDQARMGAETLFLRLVVDVAVLLSFGFLFPPLGMLALASAIVDVWLTKWMMDTWRHHQQRLNSIYGETHTDADTSGTIRAYLADVTQTVHRLEMAYTGIWRRVQRETPMVLGYSALLWAFALFDILGRDVGALQALWIFFVVLSMPYWIAWLLSAVQAGYKRLFPQSSSPIQRNDSKQEQQAEMTIFPAGDGSSEETKNIEVSA